MKSYSGIYQNAANLVIYSECIEGAKQRKRGRSGEAERVGVILCGEGWDTVEKKGEFRAIGRRVHKRGLAGKEQRGCNARFFKKNVRVGEVKREGPQRKEK